MFQKRDMQREEQEKKQDFIHDERKRTIDRLKTFKVVNLLSYCVVGF
jgi:hypothetical protein